MQDTRETVELTAPAGWQHFGCTTCGQLFMLPADESEPGPWCVHSGHNYSWREQRPPRSDWTRTVRVRAVTLTLAGA